MKKTIDNTTKALAALIIVQIVFFLMQIQIIGSSPNDIFYISNQNIKDILILLLANTGIVANAVVATFLINTK